MARDGRGAVHSQLSEGPLVRGFVCPMSQSVAVASKQTHCAAEWHGRRLHSCLWVFTYLLHCLIAGSCRQNWYLIQRNALWLGKFLACSDTSVEQMTKCVPAQHIRKVVVISNMTSFRVTRICVCHRLSIICTQKWFLGVLRMKMWKYRVLTPPPKRHYPAWIRVCWCVTCQNRLNGVSHRLVERFCVQRKKDRKKERGKGKNKNLAIANRSRVSCAHNTSRASIITPWPWNLGLGSLKISGNGTIG